MGISWLFPVLRCTLALFLVLPGAASFAAQDQQSSGFGNVLVPQPVKPSNATACVEPLEIMRRDHMKLLLDQRDKTVVEGIRTKKYSLTGCINCHAQATPEGKTVRADDPEYFCTNCHQYTGVSIDCFECHSDRPDASISQHSLEIQSMSSLAGMSSERFKSTLSTGVGSDLLTTVKARDN